MRKMVKLVFRLTVKRGKVKPLTVWCEDDNLTPGEIHSTLLRWMEALDDGVAKNFEVECTDSRAFLVTSAEMEKGGVN